MNDQDLALMHRTLVDVRERNQCEGGICDSFRCALYVERDRLFMHRDRLTKALRALMELWPDIHIREGKPDTAFPVGGSLEYWTEVSNGTIWDNPRRHALIEWLLVQTAPGGPSC